MDRRQFLAFAALGVVLVIPQTLSRDLQLADILCRLNDLESSADLYGATITGGVLRTYGTGSARLEMDSDANNLIAYDGSGTERARFGKLDDGTYGVTGRFVGGDIDGADITGANITGSTVTGGVVQTDDSGPRVEITDGAVGGVINFYGADESAHPISIRTSSNSLIVMLQDDGSGWAQLNVNPGSWGLQSAPAGVGSASVQLYSDADDVHLNCVGDLWLYPSGDLILPGLATVSGKTANAYIDPSTGELKRIS